MNDEKKVHSFLAKSWYVTGVLGSINPIKANFCTKVIILAVALRAK